MELSAEEILRLYMRRWGIESLFYNRVVCKQSVAAERIVLERWLQIRSTAWTLVQ